MFVNIFLLVLQPIPIQLPEILPTKSALPQPLKVKVKHSISSTQYQIFNLIPEIAQSSLVLVHLGELCTLVRCNTSIQNLLNITIHDLIEFV